MGNSGRSGLRDSWGDAVTMPRFMDIRCPVCGHKLMEAFGISAHLVLRVKCTCRRIIQIHEGFVAEVVIERSSQESSQT